jgi:hypothetical protein
LSDFKLGLVGQRFLLFEMPVAAAVYIMQIALNSPFPKNANKKAHLIKKPRNFSRSFSGQLKFYK